VSPPGVVHRLSARCSVAPGLTPGVALAGGPDLSRPGTTTEHAAIVRAREATDVFEEQGLDVAAGVRQPMEEYVAATGRRILEPSFMQINQAVGLPRHLDADAVAAVTAKVEELKASGFVRDELARSGVQATVAPPVRS